MNTEYQDPTETEKELIKEMPKTRTSHFHFKNSVGLSITTCPIPDTDFYVLGVSLTHKEQGSRKKGYEESLFRCLEVFNDPRREESQKNLEESDAFAIGGKGHYLVVSHEAIECLVTYLREIENGNWKERAQNFYFEPGWLRSVLGIKEMISNLQEIIGGTGNSKISSVYHQVFFDLPHVLMGICEWDDTPVQA
jgi:hypothetical protein